MCVLVSELRHLLLEGQREGGGAEWFSLWEGGKMWKDGEE